MPREGQGPVLAIIGGGYTGAAIAYHLDRLLGASTSARIVVIEPRAALGAGLAYASDDAAYRINVPAARMSMLPGKPGDFEDWLDCSGEAAADPAASLPDGRRFPRRAAFGRYVADALAPALTAGRILHRRALAVAVEKAADGYRIMLGDRSTLEADLVVIATTHPPPAVPAVFATALPADDRLIRDATRPGALDVIAADERVLIVGTGLTMADVVAALDARGHRGHVTTFSRRGQLSAPHPAAPVQPFGDFVTSPATSVRGLVHRVRAAVAEAGRHEIAPQAVFDALRAQGRAIWRALPLAERQRLVRHLRVFWDARRFRIAPQVHAVLEERRQTGRLSVLAGQARAVAVSPEGITVTLDLRHARRSQRICCDRIVIATGPAHGGLLHSVPYLASLAATGLVTADRLGLGLATDDGGRAIGAGGVVGDTLLIGGPLARATFGELMGLPEVTDYAIDLAGEIARWAVTDRRAALDARLRA